MNAHAAISYFRTFGYCVFRAAIDIAPLSDEIDRMIHEGSRRTFIPKNVPFTGKWVPATSSRTPVALSLLDLVAPIADQLFGRPMLPLRAECVLWDGSTIWHPDCSAGLSSLTFISYLEPLVATNGALRVLPGSQHRDYMQCLDRYCDGSRPAGVSVDDWIESFPATIVETQPGDLIAMHERTYHASAWGANRRQWRATFVADPIGPLEESQVKTYCQLVYRPDNDFGYDPDLYPNFDASWMASGRPCVERLRQLGAYTAAAAEEAFVRASALAKSDHHLSHDRLGELASSRDSCEVARGRSGTEGAHRKL